MIRTILVPVRGDGKGENVLLHAIPLAKRFSAHIVVSYCRARAEDMLPFGVPLPSYMKDNMKQQAEQLADVEEAKLKEEFLKIAQKANLDVTDQPMKEGISASWVARSGKQVDIIKQYGRLADLICVAKPDRDRNLGANTLKSALFHTGRPVVMCPPAKVAPQSLGDHIAIGWNGSQEASRAVAMTLDLVQKAKTITVLSSGTEPHGATASDLIDYFSLRGVTAELVEFAAGKNAGRALLSQCRLMNADMLIIGAYGDSHERETLFGGNTQAVVDHSEMPVVLVH